MWKVKWRVFCFCICTASLAKTSSDLIKYEGKDVQFHAGYASGYETNSKYLGKSNGFFSEKLVETSESNRWTRRGKFALFDNTSACVLIAAIFNLTEEDSGSYTLGVDVKMLPDPDATIQLTVIKRDEPQNPSTPSQRLITPSERPTTPSERFTTPSRRLRTSPVVVHNTNSPADITPHNRAKTINKESHHRFITVLVLVCVCTVLVVCPFSLFKALKSSRICKLSVSVSYHSRKTPTQATDEYVKMNSVVVPNLSMAKDSSVKDFHRHISTEAEPCYVEVALQDLDPTYTEMNPNFAQESIYQTIDLNAD